MPPQHLALVSCSATLGCLRSELPRPAEPILRRIHPDNCPLLKREVSKQHTRFLGNIVECRFKGRPALALGLVLRAPLKRFVFDFHQLPDREVGGIPVSIGVVA